MKCAYKNKGCLEVGKDLNIRLQIRSKFEWSAINVIDYLYEKNV